MHGCPVWKADALWHCLPMVNLIERLKLPHAQQSKVLLLVAAWPHTWPGPFTAKYQMSCALHCFQDSEVQTDCPQASTSSIWSILLRT